MPAIRVYYAFTIR